MPLRPNKFKGTFIFLRYCTSISYRRIVSISQKKLYTLGPFKNHPVYLHKLLIHLGHVQRNFNSLAINFWIFNIKGVPVQVAHRHTLG